uniref:Uncharacterized protein n=1 Tax=Lepeophtheirus salmonis TaxID=72036 RepID=A0A0K2UYS1_LEPSM
MTLERNLRISIRVRRAVWCLQEYLRRRQQVRTLERKKSSVKKDKLDPKELRGKTQGNSVRCMRPHAIDLGISNQTVQRAIKKKWMKEHCERWRDYF